MRKRRQEGRRGATGQKKGDSSRPTEEAAQKSTKANGQKRTKKHSPIANVPVGSFRGDGIVHPRIDSYLDSGISDGLTVGVHSIRGGARGVSGRKMGEGEEEEEEEGEGKVEEGKAAAEEDFHLG